MGAGGHAGTRVINTLSIEKGEEEAMETAVICDRVVCRAGFRAWGREMNKDVSPIEVASSLRRRENQADLKIHLENPNWILQNSRNPPESIFLTTRPTHMKKYGVKEIKDVETRNALADLNVCRLLNRTKWFRGNGTQMSYSHWAIREPVKKKVWKIPHLDLVVFQTFKKKIGWGVGGSGPGHFPHFFFQKI